MLIYQSIILSEKGSHTKIKLIFNEKTQYLIFFFI